MADNIVTNANHVELVMQTGTSVTLPGEDSGDETQTTVGSSQEYGRLVVDNFTITREEDDSLVSGVGFRGPGGITNGDITYSFDFTVQGSDTTLFDMIATSGSGGDAPESRIFSFTARKTNSDGDIIWEFALNTCKATSEEVSATSGDPMEYAVEGISVSMERAQPQLNNNN